MAVTADIITAIVVGVLQVAIGLGSLWQQRQLVQAYREFNTIREQQYCC
jgi:multisubunit Na+/H+ antiporter MnhC subunit